jgi:hydrocephalus-inducing protein
VLSNLDPFKPINCSFGLRDKVFNFGTVIAQLDASDTAPASVDGSSAAGSKGDKKPAKAASKQAARASINGPSSTAGSAAGAAAVSLLDEPGAVKANLKFINPIKVPCTVNFSIKPRGGAQPGVFCLQCRWLLHLAATLRLPGSCSNAELNLIKQLSHRYPPCVAHCDC